MRKTRPLKGRQILITRGGEQGMKFCKDVAAHGGISHMIPLIDFRATEVGRETFLQHLQEYDWIIFTSKNGVYYFFDHMNNYFNDVNRNKFHPNVQFAVVGEKTREALNRYGIQSHFMPNVYTAEDFTKEFFTYSFQPNKVLIPKGNLARPVIADSFRKRNILADEWIVYETFYPTGVKEQLLGLLKESKVDVVSFTSPSTFRHFMEIVNEYNLYEYCNHFIFAAIGKVTKQAIENKGFSVPICPKKFTIDAMFQEIYDYFAKYTNEGNEKNNDITI